MKFTRRKCLAWMGVASVSATAGCVATRAVEQMTNNYTEKVSSIWITSDSSRIVYIGERYHYIFDTPPELLRLLRLPEGLRSKLVADSFWVSVDNRNAVVANLQLRLNGELSAAERTAARTQNLDVGRTEVRMTGQRYLAAGPLVIGGQVTKLNRTYDVTVTEPASGVAKAIMTPIALAADGVVTLGAIVLLPLLPFWLMANMQR